MKNRNSSLKTGRTIGEKREQLETANERANLRKKEKRSKVARLIGATILFSLLGASIVTVGYFVFSGSKEEPTAKTSSAAEKYTPTIEIIDEDAAAGEITSRMKNYIGKAELDFRDLGYKPIKAVIPTNSIREIDFYLEGFSGYIKMLIDRETAVSVEDADRMLKYLASISVSEFQYIDVRIEGRAFWK